MRPVKIEIYCEFCKKNVIEIVYEDLTYPEDIFDQRYIDELKEMVEHFHWIRNHRRCAICGEVIRNDFSTTENNQDLKIHPKYKEETLQREKEELLDIHKSCYHKSR